MGSLRRWVASSVVLAAYLPVVEVRLSHGNLLERDSRKGRAVLAAIMEQVHATSTGPGCAAFSPLADEVLGLLLAWRLRRGDSSAAVFDLRKGGVRQTGVLRSLRRAAAIGLATHQEGCQRFGHADDGAWGGDRGLQGLWTKRPPPTPQASRMKGRQRSLSGVGKYVSPPSRADPKARRRSLCRTGPRRARLSYPDGRAAWAGRWLGPRASSKPGVSPHQPCGHAPPSATHPEVPSAFARTRG